MKDNINGEELLSILITRLNETFCRNDMKTYIKDMSLKLHKKVARFELTLTIDVSLTEKKEG